MAGTIRPLPPPDIVIEGSLHDAVFIVGPCHRRAADWLRLFGTGEWLGEGAACDAAEIEGVIARAIDSGFTVALHFQAHTRVGEPMVGGAGIEPATSAL